MFYSDAGITIVHGECGEVMRGMEPNSIDAIVTDPPYGLEFMGKEWDRLGDIGKVSHAGPSDRDGSTVFGRVAFNGSSNVRCRNCDKWKWGHKPGDGGGGGLACTCERPDFPSPRPDQARIMQKWHHAWATEALRIAKPGAHLLAFGGTRTFHRLACAIEDAGWEIRDCVMWVYGSGFPKSLDVSKAIDKAAGAEREIVGRRTDRAATPKCDIRGGAYIGATQNIDLSAITAPATDAAKEWAGYGTALKPSFEPIIVARKPLEGTVAQNVLTYGTGALNIDGCRVRIERESTWEDAQKLCNSCVEDVGRQMKPTAQAKKESIATSNAARIMNEKEKSNLGATSRLDTGCSDGTKAENAFTNLNTGESGKMPMELFHQDTKSTTSIETNSTTDFPICVSCGKPIIAQCTNENMQTVLKNSPQEHANSASAAPAGRWPANLIHDGSEEVLGLFPDALGSHKQKPTNSANSWFAGGANDGVGYRDTGSAARFFYTAKASFDDRGHEDLDPLPLFNEPAVSYRNAHPTVKPQALMRYLLTLVSRDDQLILDPFMGSGSTLLAAKKLGRRAIGIEIDETYIATAVRRLKKRGAGG